MNKYTIPNEWSGCNIHPARIAGISLKSPCPLVDFNDGTIPQSQAIFFVTHVRSHLYLSSRASTLQNFTEKNADR